MNLGTEYRHGDVWWGGMQPSIARSSFQEKLKSVSLKIYIQILNVHGPENLFLKTVLL